MVFFPKSSLTPLQRELLQAFFERDQCYWLTGGAALAGFYLGHRLTEDIDLFAAPGADLADAERILGVAAQSCGARLESVKRYPEYRRLIATRGSEVCVVDLVIERAPLVDPDKPKYGSIRVDTLREIASNKLCAVLGRSEAKDLVDLHALLPTFDLRQVVEDALHKDASADPATLAWVIGQIRIGPEARLPGGVDPQKLEQFREELVGRLQELALERVRAK